MAILDWLFGHGPEPQQPQSTATAAFWRSFAPDRTRPFTEPTSRSCAPRARRQFPPVVALDVETLQRCCQHLPDRAGMCCSPTNQIQTFFHACSIPAPGLDAFNIQLHGIALIMWRMRPRFPMRWSRGVAAAAADQSSPSSSHSSFDKRAMKCSLWFCGIDTPDFAWSDSHHRGGVPDQSWRERAGHGWQTSNARWTLSFIIWRGAMAKACSRAAMESCCTAEDHLSASFEDLIKASPKKSYPAPIHHGRRPAGGIGPVQSWSLPGGWGIREARLQTLAAPSRDWNRRGRVTKKTTHLSSEHQDLTVLLPGHAKSSKHAKAEEMRDAGHPIESWG